MPRRLSSRSPPARGEEQGRAGLRAGLLPPPPPPTQPEEGQGARPHLHGIFPSGTWGPVTFHIILEGDKKAGQKWHLCGQRGSWHNSPARMRGSAAPPSSGQATFTGLRTSGTPPSSLSPCSVPWTPTSCLLWPLCQPPPLPPPPMALLCTAAFRHGWQDLGWPHLLEHGLVRLVDSQVHPHPVLSQGEG